MDSLLSLVFSCASVLESGQAFVLFSIPLLVIVMLEAGARMFFQSSPFQVILDNRSFICLRDLFLHPCLAADIISGFCLVEFLAEDEIVEVVPNINMKDPNLICGDFGPFMPQIATKVPLWLVVALKKCEKCTIRPPEWMSVDRLKQVLEAERESPREFQPLPFHYVEISWLLFDHGRDDIQNMYMV